MFRMVICHIVMTRPLEIHCLIILTRIKMFSSLISWIHSDTFLHLLWYNFVFFRFDFLNILHCVPNSNYWEAKNHWSIFCPDLPAARGGTPAIRAMGKKTAKDNFCRSAKIQEIKIPKNWGWERKTWPVYWPVGKIVRYT